MKVKVYIKDIGNLKTSTSAKVEMDKDTREEIDRRLITKVQFECEVDPTALANVHRLMAAGVMESSE